MNRVIGRSTAVAVSIRMGAAVFATAAAFASIYFDLLQKAYKGGGEIPPASPDEVKTYEARPYPFFECPKP